MENKSFDSSSSDKPAKSALEILQSTYDENSSEEDEECGGESRECKSETPEETKSEMLGETVSEKGASLEVSNKAKENEKLSKIEEIKLDSDESNQKSEIKSNNLEKLKLSAVESLSSSSEENKIVTTNVESSPSETVASAIQIEEDNRTMETKETSETLVSLASEECTIQTKEADCRVDKKPIIDIDYESSNPTKFSNEIKPLLDKVIDKPLVNEQKKYLDETSSHELDTVRNQSNPELEVKNVIESQSSDRNKTEKNPSVSPKPVLHAISGDLSEKPETEEPLPKESKGEISNVLDSKIHGLTDKPDSLSLEVTESKTNENADVAKLSEESEKKDLKDNVNVEHDQSTLSIKSPQLNEKEAETVINDEENIVKSNLESKISDKEIVNRVVVPEPLKLDSTKNYINEIKDKNTLVENSSPVLPDDSSTEIVTDSVNTVSISEGVRLNVKEVCSKSSEDNVSLLECKETESSKPTTIIEAETKVQQVNNAKVDEDIPEPIIEDTNIPIDDKLSVGTSDGLEVEISAEKEIKNSVTLLLSTPVGDENLNMRKTERKDDVTKKSIDVERNKSKASDTKIILPKLTSTSSEVHDQKVLEAKEVSKVKEQIASDESKTTDLLKGQGNVSCDSVIRSSKPDESVSKHVDTLEDEGQSQNVIDVSKGSSGDVKPLNSPESSLSDLNTTDKGITEAIVCKKDINSEDEISAKVPTKIVPEVKPSTLGDSNTVSGKPAEVVSESIKNLEDYSKESVLPVETKATDQQKCSEETLKYDNNVKLNLSDVQSDHSRTKTETSDLNVQIESRESSVSSEPPKRVKLVRPKFTPKATAIKTPNQTVDKPVSVSFETQSQVVSSAEVSRKLVSENEPSDITVKDITKAVEEQSISQVSLKAKVEESRKEVLQIDKQPTSSIVKDKQPSKLEVSSLKVESVTNVEVDIVGSKVKNKEILQNVLLESKKVTPIGKETAETESSKVVLSVEGHVKEDVDLMGAKGDALSCPIVKTPDSPKRVKLVRPITVAKKPSPEKPKFAASDSTLLRQRLEEKLVKRKAVFEESGTSKRVKVTTADSETSGSGEVISKFGSVPSKQVVDPKSTESTLVKPKLSAEQHDKVVKDDVNKTVTKPIDKSKISISTNVVKVVGSKETDVPVKNKVGSVESSSGNLNDKVEKAVTSVGFVDKVEIKRPVIQPEGVCKSDEKQTFRESTTQIEVKQTTTIVADVQLKLKANENAQDKSVASEKDEDRVAKEVVTEQVTTELPQKQRLAPQKPIVVKNAEERIEMSPQIKQLEYTLKIGKDSTRMIPKDDKVGAGSEQHTPVADNSLKMKEILTDSDVTITPIISNEASKSNTLPKDTFETKPVNDSEKWKHLTDVKILPVQDQSKAKILAHILDKRKKVENQDGAVLTTSSGVQINLHSTSPKILNALISENQASSGSDDVQFVKVVPAQRDPIQMPLNMPNMAGLRPQMMMPMPIKRRRGRPRKIPLEPRPQMDMQQMMMAAAAAAAGGHGVDEFGNSLFSVPLFDMSETMFTTGHTLFPDQVTPMANRPQRSCRGRIKLPSVRTRRPRGSSMSGRVSASGRGRGRGYKRRFTEDENIITIDNVEQEMMRHKPGRRRLSAGSRMDDDDEGERKPETEEERKQRRIEKIKRRKEEKRLRLLEKKRLRAELREKEKADAISAALGDEETRMSAPEGMNKEELEGLYAELLAKRRAEGDDYQAPTPKRRREHYFCCICLEETPLRKLTSPLDHRSWTVLYEAAIVRQFEPILKLTDDMNKEIPATVLYHRNCRSEFTHKKTLAKLTETTVNELSELQNSENPSATSNKEFTVDQIAEYQWPLLGGELFMLQEQISIYLGVKSFKRKYPDIKRRTVDMEERQYLCDHGLVSESLCDLGLTAVNSAEVLDIMFADFPDKYEEFRKHIREKQARELSSKQKAALCSLLDKKKLEQRTDTKQEAMQSAASWNSNLNKSRREYRRCSLDLQSLIIHYPKSKGQKMCPVTEPRPVGHYPVALIPGQYCDFYKRYTPDELRYFPLDTVLYGPILPNERYGGPTGSDSSQSDSDNTSSSEDSSDTSSEGTQDTEETCEEEDKEREKEKHEEAHCKVCGGDKTRNKNDQPEVMVHCAQCTKSCQSDFIKTVKQCSVILVNASE